MVRNGMVKQFQLHSGTNGLDLVLREVPGLQPHPGEVQLRVHAAALNYRDLLMRQGQSATSANEGGTVPLSDGSGEVIAVGEGVTRLSAGDRVAGCFFSHWLGGRFEARYHRDALGGSADGMLSEEVVLPEEGVIKIPGHLSFEEAACLPCAGLTAFYSLFERGDLQPGDSVLVLGTGGVSIFALQLATAHGARVIVTSSNDAKLERAHQLGAWKTLNYRSTPDWEKEVWALSEKRGVDHVVEVGGPGTIEKSMACVAPGGHIALIGVLTGKGAPDASLFPLVTKNVRLNGIYVGHRAAFERMNAFLTAHQIRPVIDRVFAFEESLQAYEHLASGAHFGKVVIKF